MPLPETENGFFFEMNQKALSPEQEYCEVSDLSLWVLEVALLRLRNLPMQTRQLLIQSL